MNRTDDTRAVRGTLEAFADEALDVALAAHATFDRDIWKRSVEARVPTPEGEAAPSYHNEHHIRSVVDCVRAVFGQALTGPDPFCLREDLDRWNRARPPLSFDELAWVSTIAFACHDLGNIAEGPDIVTAGDGRPGIAFRAWYDSSTLHPAPLVEIRSADIADGLLRALVPEPGFRDRFEPAIRHLVMQTVFHFEKTESENPFWLMMQTVDMIGSYFFSPVSRCEAVAGLFAEMRVQKLGSVPVVGFLTSLKERFDNLLKSPSDRDAVLAVFESNPHGWKAPVVFGVPERFASYRDPVPLADAIRILLG